MDAGRAIRRDYSGVHAELFPRFVCDGISDQGFPQDEQLSGVAAWHDGSHAGVSSKKGETQVFLLFLCAGFISSPHSPNSGCLASDNFLSDACKNHKYISICT